MIGGARSCDKRGMRALTLVSLVLPLVLGCSPEKGTASLDGGDADAADDGMVPSPSDGGTTVTDGKATLRMTSFAVPAGHELFMCQDFKNPFGVDTEIAGFEAHMAPGSHHMLFLYQPNAVDGEVHPCSGLTFAQMAFGSQQSDVVQRYPDGVAALVPADQGFRVVSHYLNASPKDLVASVEIVLHKAAPGTVTQHAGVYFLNNISGIHVAPGQRETVTAQYVVPHDLYLLSGVGHMHMRGKSLVATIDGAKLYESDSWDNSPQTDFTPPVFVEAGSVLSWACDIDNTTTNTLIFGESAETNEMCIFDGQYYPVLGDRPNLEQQQ